MCLIMWHKSHVFSLILDAIHGFYVTWSTTLAFYIAFFSFIFLFLVFFYCNFVLWLIRWYKSHIFERKSSENVILISCDPLHQHLTLFYFPFWVFSCYLSIPLELFIYLLRSGSRPQTNLCHLCPSIFPLLSQPLHDKYKSRIYPVRFNLYILLSQCLGYCNLQIDTDF